jgi:hypothetical protein
MCFGYEPCEPQLFYLATSNIVQSVAAEATRLFRIRLEYSRKSPGLFDFRC